jgi:putative ABC transport system ATP-binding protein
MTAILDARDIRKTYRGEGSDVEALRGVSVRVERGDFVALTGPSGCGKSTLLNILACMDRPDSGALLLEGHDVSSLDDDALTAVRRTRIGYVFQFFNLLATLSVAENVGLPLTLSGAPRRESRNAVREALARVGLLEQAQRRPSALSGGQQQRVAIARAIVHRPAIVLADEPTGNLDSATGRDILTLLASLSDAGVAMLIATHSADAAGFAHRTVRMRDGRIEAP